MKEKKLNKLLSIKVSDDERHTIFNICGAKIKIKREPKNNEKIYIACKQIQTKLSMPDDICRINNIKFYVPNYPLDTIQKCIVDKSEFYENDILKELEKYIPTNAVIIDIGTNIGNHSIYWATQLNPKQIYAFEPIDTTFKILEKNIALNNLEETIKPYNIGLSDEKSTAIISEYSNDNIGGTSITKCTDKKGLSIKVDTLDNIKIPETKIDFIKIDVEGHEILVLKGAEETLKKHKPLIFIEIFPDNFTTVNDLLTNYGYKIKKTYQDNNYLFEHI